MRQSQAIEKLSVAATCITVFKAFVGTGILYQPYYYWLCGTGTMAIGHAGALALSLYCASLLFKTADQHGDSFGELAFKAGGPGLKLATEVCIVVAQTFFCVNYIYFIMSQIGGVINCIIKPDDPDNANYDCSEATYVQ